MTRENFIYGIRPVIEALKAGKEIDRILIQARLKGEGIRQLQSMIRELEIAFQFVPVDKLNRLSRQNHQGVVAYISEITYTKIESIVPFIYEQGKIPLLLALDRITDVRNFGAIARTAECAGTDAILIPAKGSAMINSDAIKTSAGALYKLPVCRSTDMRDDIAFLKSSGLRIFAATEKAETLYSSADFTMPMTLIMGSEENGISDEYLKLADERIKIPLQGEIASLNVSVASGILLFEILRQRIK